MRQVCVIGLGQFGTHLARTLVRMGCEVLAIDIDGDRVDEVRDDVHRALVGDVRNYQMLESIVSPDIDEAVIGLGERSIEPSILCTLNLKKMGIKLIRSTARNEDHAQILRAVGASDIIFPEQDTAERISRRIANPNLRDMFPLTEDYRIMEIATPKKLHGKSIQETELRRKYELLVIAVRTEQDDHYRFLPGPDTVLKPGELLMVLGRELDLARFAALD